MVPLSQDTAYAILIRVHTHQISLLDSYNPYLLLISAPGMLLVGIPRVSARRFFIYVFLIATSFFVVLEYRGRLEAAERKKGILGMQSCIVDRVSVAEIKGISHRMI